MAEDKKPKRRPIVKKKTETLRQRTERVTESASKPKARRVRATASRIGKPFRTAHRIGKKTYYLPMPKNRAGRIMNTHVRVFPRFFKNAWGELRLVEWPSTKVTLKLTYAVFIFAIIFGLFITLEDYGLDKVFRKVFLK